MYIYYHYLVFFVYIFFMKLLIINNIIITSSQEVLCHIHIYVHICMAIACWQNQDGAVSLSSPVGFGEQDRWVRLADEVLISHLADDHHLFFFTRQGLHIERRLHFGPPHPQVGRQEVDENLADKVEDRESEWELVFTEFLRVHWEKNENREGFLCVKISRIRRLFIPSFSR